MQSKVCAERQNIIFELMQHSLCVFQHPTAWWLLHPDMGRPERICLPGTCGFWTLIQTGVPPSPTSLATQPKFYKCIYGARIQSLRFQLCSRFWSWTTIATHIHFTVVTVPYLCVCVCFQVKEVDVQGGEKCRCFSWHNMRNITSGAQSHILCGLHWTTSFLTAEESVSVSMWNYQLTGTKCLKLSRRGGEWITMFTICKIPSAL